MLGIKQDHGAYFEDEMPGSGLEKPGPALAGGGSPWQAIPRRRGGRPRR
jgi:hypothetical protein